MRLFYDPLIENTGTLEESEARHAIKVLRLKQGDKIQVIDGKGNLYTCTITATTKKDCDIHIDKKESFKPDTHHFHIAICPTKNQDRIEWFVEKVIEIGIQEITFVESKRTERNRVKEERIHRIVISAMKQSLKYWEPKINYLTPIKEVISDCNTDTKLIAHLNEGDRHTVESASKGKSITMLIGPEGDFTDEEVNDATQKGFTPVTLGKSRLRTETAGIFSCVQLNLLAL